MKSVLVVAFLVGVALGYLRLQHPWNGEYTLINITFLMGSGVGLAILGSIRYLLAKLIGLLGSWVAGFMFYGAFAMYKNNHYGFSSEAANFNLGTLTSYEILFSVPRPKLATARWTTDVRSWRIIAAEAIANDRYRVCPMAR
jgi:hypothetical protein